MTDNMISKEMPMEKKIPNISKLISPLLDVAFQKQEKIGNINFVGGDSTRYGVWHTSICVNATTEIFHTEKDVTYTLISIPGQVYENHELMRRKPSFFLFDFNADTKIAIRMNQFVSFVFSGEMLTHRQHCSDNKSNVKLYPFFNIGCYGNEKLYHHLRKLFIRKQNI